MSYMMEEARFMAGTCVGVAGTFAAWQFGPVLAASSWTSAGCAAALMAAAAAVASGRWMASGIDPVLLDMAGTPARSPEGFEWRQPDRPRDWLRDKGIEAVPDAQVPDFLRATLSACLTLLPARGPDPFGQAPADAATALAVALAARSSGGARRADGARLVLALGRAHAETEPAERASLTADAFGEAGRLLAHPDVKDACYKALARHGTRETLLMGLLREARRTAAIGPSEFSWLKGVDRGLWYALDNLGRRTFHVEGLAAMDHFAHEEAASGYLEIPHVDVAAAALAEVVAEMRAEPGRQGGTGGATAERP